MSLIYAVLLLVLFLILLVLELFIPSGGLLGVAAAASIIASIILGFMHSLAVGALLLVATAVIVPVLISVGLRAWPHTAMGKRMLTIDPDANDAIEVQLRDQREAMVGKTGIAKTNLLPSGLVEIEGKRIDAISIGMAIDKGERIEVVSVVSGKVRVQPYYGEVNSKSIPATLETPIESLGIDDWRA